MSNKLAEIQVEIIKEFVPSKERFEAQLRLMTLNMKLITTNTSMT